MAKRSIIKINEKKCNGCGLCIPNCPEGALKIIDGKARLISDLFCDGLGACIGHCPKGAIIIEKREAEKYDEVKVMGNIIKQGKNTIKAHLEHLKDHKQHDYLKQAISFLKEKRISNPLEEEKMNKQHSHGLPFGCPGSMLREVKPDSKKEKNVTSSKQKSELRQWPIQLNLLPPSAPFFHNSDLLIAADCTGIANPNFHGSLLKGKSIAIGCPKLDDLEGYKEKIKGIIESNDLKTITVAIMEVPCCYGLYSIVEEALDESGKKIPLSKIVVGIDGNIRN